ncbi:MAG TPA: tryptophan synthase subunit alpha [Rhizomicrobium sp.]|jgi:tryptophan synthase alpha chain
MSRISTRFTDLKRADRAAFIPFITAGDPDEETSFAILEKLPQSGADLIELGVPFSDPMADGPAIQAASLRALNAGMRLSKVLDMVRRFRERDTTTPIILMGYFNPIHHYGTEAFVRDAAEAGVDGLITVDLPPEEDGVLRASADARGLDIIRLAAPTTDDKRLVTVLQGASGFLYYVSVAGVTGTTSYAQADVATAVARLKRQSKIPCAVGFGIKTAEQAAAIAQIADGAVVGSAIVSRIAGALESGRSKDDIVSDVLIFCKELAQSVHAARAPAVVE